MSCDLTTVPDLDVPAIFDTAIIYFVCARAFLDDNDAGSAQKAANFMQLYQAELDVIIKSSAVNNSKAASLHRVTYNGPFSTALS